MLYGITFSSKQNAFLTAQLVIKRCLLLKAFSVHPLKSMTIKEILTASMLEIQHHPVIEKKLKNI